MPVYEVTKEEGSSASAKSRLVRANTQHQARVHISKDNKVTIPSAERLVQLGREGVEIEDAGTDEPEAGA